MLWCSLRVIWSETLFDLVFIDQVSAIIPFFKLFADNRVIYYCHHPDLLLIQYDNKKSKILKRAYRQTLDFFEAISTANCDELLVNSKYTQSIVLKTFPLLKTMPFIQPKVVYPAIDTVQYQNIGNPPNDRITFLSINRYERKKEIDFAIRSFAKLQMKKIKLIIAGGYDERVRENKLYFDELLALCNDLKLKYQCIEHNNLINDDDH